MYQLTISSLSHSTLYYTTIF